MEDLDKAHVIELNNAFILRMHGNFIYGCWKTIKELWKIWATFMFLNQTTYSLWRGVKMSNGCWISRNFERPIQGSCSLTKHAISFNMCAYVKRMLQNYQGILKNLEILMFFNWTMVSFSRCMEMSKRCQKIIKEPWRTLAKLMFLNQMMHALWTCMKISKMCWKTIKECWRTLIKFMFLNQTIHALWTHMDILNEC